MKKLMILILMFVFGKSIAQTNLQGIVIDRETNKPIPNVLVRLFEAGDLIFEMETDEFGEFIFDELEAGIFEVDFSNLEYQSLHMSGIEVVEEEETLLKVRLDIGLSLDKIAKTFTQKALRKADRKLRKYVKGLPGKGFRRLKKKVRKRDKDGL